MATLRSSRGINYTDGCVWRFPPVLVHKLRAHGSVIQIRLDRNRSDDQRISCLSALLHIHVQRQLRHWHVLAWTNNPSLYDCSSHNSVQIVKVRNYTILHRLVWSSHLHSTNSSSCDMVRSGRTSDGIQTIPMDGRIYGLRGRSTFLCKQVP